MNDSNKNSKDNADNHGTKSDELGNGGASNVRNNGGNSGASIQGGGSSNRGQNDSGSIANGSAQDEVNANNPGHNIPPPPYHSKPIVNPRTHREYPQEGGRLDAKRH